ncbi:MAG: MotA/TolQ/ExbB proton channel family protein [Rhodopila sp.]|nr:MotA/TolQ/ExbB proton channel family protein [Rhodopila sp.]
MTFDRAWLHSASFDLLYASLVIATFVILERGIYFCWLGICRRRVARAVRENGAVAAAAIQSRDAVTRTIRDYVTAQKAEALSRGQIDDLSAALFLEIDGRVQARLWLLDTIVTAAPLLGLLGTILGIMDTFEALSSGGISDPAAVSRGIAMALLATAIGIGTALYGLLGHNLLHRLADDLTESVKGLLLRTTLVP